MSDNGNVAIPEGWKLVPIEPDDAMIEAASEEIAERRSFGMHVYGSDIYEVMLRAAPQPVLSQPEVKAEAVAWFMHLWNEADEDIKSDVRWGSPTVEDIERAEHNGHDIEYLYDRALCPLSDIPAQAGERTHSNSVGVGMAIAAGIVMNCWGETTYAREILGAAGATSLDIMRGWGVDDYDLNILSPLFATASEGSTE